MNEEKRYMVEDVILELAEIIRENKYLREENARLRKIEKEYNQCVNDYIRASDESSRNILNAALVGIAVGKKDMDFAREIVKINR